ncbi:MULTISPECIES: ABC transporter ATP-binding protein [unclassified Paenibacillus]|uniref:ABC transporter ATP-binding protein n=1 Tax=unclassified Paenibacillus TaxID=185978 RepID=UPI0003E255F9|nr:MULTISPECIES: ABC transporter ATP-binding protein [unclassified Paenibacillus]ETT38155.1 ABC transporter ATPase [Paenibacillus sp. FSL R7-269]OMF88310.1 ABC transporter ATP-binding protein [Paenibacillus sp. FSL R7-0337]
MILEGKKLCKYYGTGDRQVKAIHNVDFSVAKGEFISIVGQSGAGKSTLMHIIGGLDAPTSGEVIINGTSIYTLPMSQLAVFRRRQIGFVFQAFNLVPSLNVWENIILPIGLDGKKADVSYIEDILNTLGIYEKRASLPTVLSGGQQQRVAIARALAARPAIVLADEPTGNLDSRSSNNVLDLLRLSVEKYNQTLIVVTHNDEVAKLAGRTVRVVDGSIVVGVEG